MKAARGPGDRGTGGPSVALAIAVFAGLCLAGPAVPVLAQNLPAVRTAIRLAAEGRGDSARRLVEAELARARPGDSAYVEALYWRARLRPWGDSAERDLRRVAIEFSTSSWADDALLQLAQLAMAAGNPAAALTLAGRLRGDYPDSELRPRAAFWAGRAAFEVGEPRTGCALLDSARTEAATDVEFVNQVAFYLGRCAALAITPPRAESTRAPEPVAPEPRAPAESTATPAGAPAGTSPAERPRPFEVQVAASRSESAARQVADRLTRAGFGVRTAIGSDGYSRVRVGPYETIEAAEGAAQAVRRLIGGSPFVVRTP